MTVKGPILAAMEQPTGVVHFGLGPIGLAVAAVVAERSWLRSRAAIAASPELRGRPLAELTGVPAPGSPPVAAAYSPVPEARVALHCTGSSLDRVASQIVELAASGLCVISTTE